MLGSCVLGDDSDSASFFGGSQSAHHCKQYEKRDYSALDTPNQAVRLTVILTPLCMHLA